MRGLLAEYRQSDADISAVRLARRLPCTHGADIDRRRGAFEALRIVARIEMLPGDVFERHPVGTGQIAQPEFMRLDAELAGERIDQGFERETHPGPGHPPIRQDRRLVGGRRPGPAAKAGKVVGSGKNAGDLRRFQTGRERIGGIGAGIHRRLALDRQQPPVGSGMGGDLVVMFATVGVCRQLFPPVFDPAHRTAGPDRDPGQRHLFRQQDALVAEPAADIGRDDADLAFVEPETLGEAGSHDMRDLGRRRKAQQLQTPIPFGDGAASLDRRHRLARGAQRPCHRHRGLLLEGLHIGVALDEGLEKDVVAPMFVHQRRARGARLKHVRNHRQRFDVDLDRGREILRIGACIGETGGDNLADIAHLVGCQDRLQRRLEPGQCGIGPNGSHAVTIGRDEAMVGGLRGLGAAPAPAVCDRASQERHLAHAEPLYIGHELALARQKAGVLLAPDCLADTA